MTQPVATRNAEPSADVLLVSMPFGPLLQPSIGLSLLKGVLADQSISASILYFTLRYARAVGSEFYVRIADGYPGLKDLAGEWIFSEALFGPGDVDGYVNGVLLGDLADHRETHSEPKIISQENLAGILAARRGAAAFVESCLTSVLLRKPKIVGFTSVFQQQVSSLALAKRIKEASPETQIVFGGANCEGKMGAEVIRQFPFVDAVVSGQGEIVFPELVRRVLAGQDVGTLPGVYTRSSNGRPDGLTGADKLTAPAPVLDDLPFVNYDDFFAQLEQAGLPVGREKVRVLFETSRGCWWGEKHHCTFCGLNGGSMAFRSKSARRALDELAHLARRYRGHHLAVVDNILDMKYFNSFVPELAEMGLDVKLFYEVKANLKKEQVRQLKRAGITVIQPGVESLSDHVLELMRKGVKGLQNIQLLKWCKEFGVQPLWNILWGFPGERPEDYAKMAQLVPYLTHLHPPVGTGTIRLDRFSPNFDFAEALGFSHVKPFPAYTYVYPLAAEAVANLAYHFTFAYQEERAVEAYTQPLARQVLQWRTEFSESDLFFIDKGEHLLVWDLRAVARQPLVLLTGLQRLLYLYCDQLRGLNSVVSYVRGREHGSPDEGRVVHSLGELCELGLMLEDEGSYLSLAVPLGTYSPPKTVLQRLRTTVERIGHLAAGKFTISTDSYLPFTQAAPTDLAEA